MTAAEGFASSRLKFTSERLRLNNPNCHQVKRRLRKSRGFRLFRSDIVLDIISAINYTECSFYTWTSS